MYHTLYFWIIYISWKLTFLLTDIFPKGGTFSRPWFFRIEWTSQIWNYYGRDDIWPKRKFLSTFIWILLHIEPKMPFKICFFQINNLHTQRKPEMVIFSGHLSMLLNYVSNTILCLPCMYIVCKHFFVYNIQNVNFETLGSRFWGFFFIMK